MSWSEAIRSSDPVQQTTALLQLANNIAYGRDVQHEVSIVVKEVLGRSSGNVGVRKEAYEILQTVVLTEKDWQQICSTIQYDLGGQEPQLCISALEVLAAVPSHHLIQLLEGEVGASIYVNIAHEVAQVRVAAVRALAEVYSKGLILDSVSKNNEMTEIFVEWWKAALNHLADVDDAVVSATSQAVLSVKTASDNDSLTEDAQSVANILLLEASEFISENLSDVVVRTSKADREARVDIVLAVATALAYQIENQDEQKDTDLALQGQMELFGQLVGKELTGLDPRTCFGYSQALFTVARAIQSQKSPIQSVLNKYQVLASSALDVLQQLWLNKTGQLSQNDLMLHMSSALDVLSYGECIRVSSKLLKKVHQLPMAEDRVISLYNIYHASINAHMVMKLDPTLGHIGQDLETLMNDPFLNVLLRDEPLPKDNQKLAMQIKQANYPAYKREIVEVLLEVFINHPLSNSVRKLDIISQSQQSVDVQLDEFASAISSAACVQNQAVLETWLECAYTILQSTQACMGWQTDSESQSSEATLPADNWLRVVQLACGVLQNVLSDLGYVSLKDALRLKEAELSGRLAGILAQGAGLQTLLNNMISFWDALPEVLKPRVLWVVGHNIELALTLDDTWRRLFTALREMCVTVPNLHLDIEVMELTESSRQGRLPFTKPVSKDVQKRALFGFKEIDIFMQDLFLPKKLDASSAVEEGLTVSFCLLQKYTEVLHSNFSYRTSIPAGSTEIMRNIVQILKSCEQAEFADDRIRAQCQALIKYVSSIEPIANDDSEVADQNGIQGESETLYRYYAMDVYEGYPFSSEPLSLAFLDLRRYKLHHSIERFMNAAWEQQQQRNLAYRFAAGVNLEGEIMQGMRQGEQVGEQYLADEQWSEEVELGGSGDVLRVFGKYYLQRALKRLVVQFRAQNAWDKTIDEVVIKIGPQGPLTVLKRADLQWELQNLSQETEVVWHVQFTLGGSLMVGLHLDVSFKINSKSVAQLTLSQFNINIFQLFKKTAMQIPPTQFARRWDSCMYSTYIESVASVDGLKGSLLVLSQMLQLGLQLVQLKILTAQGGLEASLTTQTLNEQYVCVKVISQVMPIPTALCVGAEVVDSISSTQRFGAHPLIKIFVRSSSQEFISSVSSIQQRFVEEMSGGFAASGFEPRPPPVSGNFDINPKIYEFVSWSQLNKIENAMMINIPEAGAEEEQLQQAGVEGGEEGVEPAPDYRVLDGVMDSILAQWQLMQVV